MKINRNKKTIIKEVFSSYIGDLEGLTIEGFLANLNASQENYKNLTISLDGHTYSPSGYLYLSVNLERLETDEELEERIKLFEEYEQNAKEAKKNKQKQTEEYERKEWERLNKKYGKINLPKPPENVLVKESEDKPRKKVK